MQTFLIILAFIFSIWLKEIFGLLIHNDNLIYAYSFGVVIIMSYSYRPIYFGPISKLQYHYITKDLWKISFVAGILNVLSNITLIPFFGIWGAVFSTYISLMFMAFRGYFLKSYVQNSVVNYYPIFWFCLITISTILVFILKDYSPIFKFFTSIFLLSIVYFLQKV